MEFYYAEGEDFLTLPFELVLDDSLQPRVRTNITVLIVVDDEVVENPENITVLLLDVNTSRMSIQPPELSVIIQDNDGELN